MDFSNEQKNIITAPIDNILVSAAAGSGKTTVLVERIITKILNGDFSIDELLVVTFTNEAADNMRKKINKQLKERIKVLKANPIENKDVIKNLQLQLDKLPNAYIQTLNSFCARVIKEKGYVYSDPDTGEMLEPGIPILDENTLGIIRANAVSDALSSLYEDLAGNDGNPELKEDFVLLTQMFGDGRNDQALCEAVENAFKMLRSIPDYINSIEALYEERIVTERAGEIYGLKDLLEEVVDCCRLALKSITQISEMVNDFKFVVSAKNDKVKHEEWDEFIQSFTDYMNRVIDIADSAKASQNELFEAFVDIKALDTNSYPTLPGYKNGNDEHEVCEFIRLFSNIAAILLLRKSIFGMPSRTPNGYNGAALLTQFDDDYGIFFRNSFEDLFDYQVVRNKELFAFIEFLKRTDACYKRRKRQVHGMDFADQEHLAYNILSNKDNSDARDYYRDRFVEIYIDEYQDNSKLQDAIIDVFARKNSGETSNFGNVFRVGDVKQSIYKFRYASPKLFNDRMKKYDAHDGGVLYLLNRNYRSDSTVINFVNFIFEQLMCEESGTEITYDDNQRLVFNEEYVKTHDSVVPNVVFYNKNKLIDEEGKEIEYKDKDSVSQVKYVQRQSVLREVIKYINEGYKPSEICVLTRTNKTALLFADYLNYHGYPAKVVENRELFNDMDIKGISNLILCLGNQYRDEYLLGVLLSDYRFTNFTLDEIAEIIAFSNEFNREKMYLIDKLAFYLTSEDNNSVVRARVQRFFDSFNKLRMQNIMTDIGILIESIYAETGLGATLQAKDELEAEKLMLFKDFLCQNYISMGSDIAGVAQYLEQMQLKLTSNVTMRIDDTSDNKIRCMTCHSSKGLEFECVILAELTNRASSNNGDSIEFDADFGFVVRDYIGDRYCIQDSLENLVVTKKRHLASLSEDMRLLYVALTRAKSRLSVVIEHQVSGAAPRDKTLIQYAYAQKNKIIDKLAFNNLKTGMSEIMFLSIARTEQFEKCIVDANEMEHCFCERPLSCGNLFTCELIGVDDIYREYSSLVPVATSDKKALQNVEEIPNFIDENEYSEEENGIKNKNNKDTVFFKEELKTSNKQIELHNISSTSDGMPVFEDYTYEASTNMPFKVSVSQLKNEFEVQKNVSMNLELPKLSEIKAEQDEAASAADVGTFIHGIMRYIDVFLLSENPEAFDSEIVRLHDNGIILDRQMSLVDKFKPAILFFAQSDVTIGMKDAMLRNELYKEKPIVFSIPVSDKSAEDYALVQGVIDMYFIDKDGEAVLVDYKTDNLSKFPDDEARKEEAIRRHKVQLDLYAAALESSGIKVKKKILCLLRHNIFAEF